MSSSTILYERSLLASSDYVTPCIVMLTTATLSIADSQSGSPVKLTLAALAPGSLSFSLRLCLSSLPRSYSPLITPPVVTSSRRNHLTVWPALNGWTRALVHTVDRTRTHVLTRCFTRCRNNRRVRSARSVAASNSHSYATLHEKVLLRSSTRDSQFEDLTARMTSL